MTRQKVALITGASSGIGYATALEFAKRGYKTYACARRLEPMAQLKKEGVLTVKCDVTSLEDVQKLKEAISQDNDGYLDILFNNAGQLCTFPALDVTDDQVAQCFEVNVFAPVRLTREFALLLIKAKGVVGFTGSVSAVTPFPFSCIYSATKAAIHQYAATLRLELKPFGVKVLGIVTGGVKTNIADTRGLPDSLWFNVPGIKEALVERQQMAARNNPMPAETYARKVADDFEAAVLGGKLYVYRGHLASFLGFYVSIFPRRLVEYVLVRRFKLSGVFDFIARRESKQALN